MKPFVYGDSISHHLGMISVNTNMRSKIILQQLVIHCSYYRAAKDLNVGRRPKLIFSGSL